MSNFNFVDQLKLDDYRERMEALVESLMHEINTDDETWSKKGYHIGKALQENDANALLIAICGWSAGSLAKKAMLVRDEDKEFLDEPVEADITVTWEDEEETESSCMVDPQTHEVYDFEKSVFENDGKQIKKVAVRICPIDDPYSFVCIESKKMPESKTIFWYDPDHFCADDGGFAMERKTITKHISEVKQGDIILFEGEECEATTDAFLTKTETGKEWNVEVDGDEYIWASELDGAMAEVVEAVTCADDLADGATVDFTCAPNMKAFADSMLHDSDTTVATVTYSKDDHYVVMDLMVRGSVSVTFNGETYTKPSEFPAKLRQMIADNPNKWNCGSEAKDYGIYIRENNWFEFIYDVDNGESSDGVMCELDLTEMTHEDLLKHMIKLCEGVLADVV